MVPSVFEWNTQKRKRKLPVKRYPDSDTDTASEREPNLETICPQTRRFKWIFQLLAYTDFPLFN